MNGLRTTYMRKGYLLTALAAAVLLAASSGTAWAQDVEIESLTLASPTVNEGGEATATLKFKVTVADDGTAVSNGAATVGFGFSVAGTPPLATSDTATNAVEAAFIGLTDTATESTALVRGINVAVGQSQSYTATRTFGLNDDLDAENGQFRLTGSVAGIGTTTTQDPIGHYTIVDKDPQKYVLSIGNTRNMIDEATTGDPTQVFLVADPKRTVPEAVPDFTVRGPRGFFAGLGADGALEQSNIEAALDNGNDGAPSAPAFVIGNISPSADKNRSDDTMTLMLYTGGVGASDVVNELSITVVDIHKLPAADAITAEAKDDDTGGDEVTEITEGGDPVYLTITVDRGSDTDPRNKTTTEALAINISSSAAQTGDFKVEPARVGLGTDSTRGEQMTTEVIKLTALTNDDVGVEDLVLNLVVSGVAGSPEGDATGTFSITVIDKTEPKIWALPEGEQAIEDASDAAAGDDGLNPRDSFMVEGSALFGVMAGYSPRYSVSASGDDAVDVSVSPTAVSVTAKKAGTSMVRVTATAEMASSSFTSEQSVSDEALIMFEVTVVDKDLVVTVTADPTEIMEGGTSTITATANREIEMGDDAVEINLEVVGDATVEPGSIMIAMGEMSGSAMLTATEDDDYADETVTVVATGSGIDAARQIAIAVMDNDEAPVDPAPSNTIWPRSQEDAYPFITDAIEAGAGDEGLNPGESFSVMASDLFTLMDGYTASYGVSVDGDAATASASGDSVSVTADMAGEAKVTITGTSRMASSSFAPEQVATNVADITFLVTVVDKPLAALVVMLEMPANVMMGNIVEGESYDIVASANRMVTAEEGSVEVMILRDRAASDAGDGDFTVDNATIMAGYDSATATLMVTEDMEPDSGTNDNMGESLVLYGMVDGEETNSLTFTIWDQAVPTLPLIAQLLLALFLMLGGARLYRRRQG